MFCCTQTYWHGPCHPTRLAVSAFCSIAIFVLCPVEPTRAVSPNTGDRVSILSQWHFCVVPRWANTGRVTQHGHPCQLPVSKNAYASAQTSQHGQCQLTRATVSASSLDFEKWFLKWFLDFKLIGVHSICIDILDNTKFVIGCRNNMIWWSNNICLMYFVWWS
jgi:hypothetical protein